MTRDWSSDVCSSDLGEKRECEGMMVILRPGPYVCAEWEFGGYPWWLQNVKGMEIRRDNPEFLKYTKAYIDRL